MKKYMMMAALAAATVGLFTSCSEEEIVKVSAQTGEPIRFAATARVAETRTVYGEKDGNQWPLYWVDGDQVKIYSPQAQTIEGKKNTADYTVSGADGTNVYSVQGDGLYWGAEDTHNFYEAYPASEDMKIEDGVLTATMPSTQNATLVNGYYVDMNAALMAGATSCSRSSIDAGGVELPFAPIFTAIDITITASDRYFDLRNISVASVDDEVVEEGETPKTVSAPLAGTFTYDFNGAVQPTDDNDVKLVQVLFPSENGGEGVKIEAGESVNVTAFVLGNYDGAVKVYVNGKFEEDTNLTILVKKGDPTKPEHHLAAGLRNHILMGLLPEGKQQTPSGAPLGSNWMAFEKNAKLVSQMSLPGSYDSGNFVEGTNGDIRTQTNSVGNLFEQTKDSLIKNNIKRNPSDDDVKYAINGNRVINYQLDHGVRVFDMRMKWDDSKGFYVNRRTGTNSYANNPNATIFKDFVGYALDWLSNHKTEFLVMFLRGDDAYTTQFNTNISSQLAEILSGNEDRYLINFDPNITVAQARGKILFVEVNYNGAVVGNTLSGWNLSTGFQNPKWGSNNQVVQLHDLLEGPESGSATRYNNKLKSIRESLGAAVSDTKGGSTWHITCTAFHRSSGTNISNESKNINPEVINYVDGLIKGEDCVGIVLSAYVCTTAQSGQELVDKIWQLNFK